MTDLVLEFNWIGVNHAVLSDLGGEKSKKVVHDGCCWPSTDLRVAPPNAMVRHVLGYNKATSSAVVGFNPDAPGAERLFIELCLLKLWEMAERHPDSDCRFEIAFRTTQTDKTFQKLNLVQETLEKLRALELERISSIAPCSDRELLGIEASDGHHTVTYLIKGVKETNE